MLRPYKERCNLSLDCCIICGQPLSKKDGWKMVEKNGEKVKLCKSHPTPTEK